MRFDIMTLFPDMFKAVLNESITGRAADKGIIELKYHNIRDYSLDKNHRVDDSPYGGGKGMIMQFEPIYNCYKAVAAGLNTKPYVIYMSPQGKTLTQQRVKELAEYKNLIILCGHYEGIDQRIIDEIVDEEISIGDYVLTGGEIPAMILADAVSRMVPGVLADEVCFTDESHFSGLLEYPHYTRPCEIFGRTVPDVLLNGNHAEINKWRRQKAIENTALKRPELLKKANLTEEEKKIAASVKRRHKKH